MTQIVKPVKITQLAMGDQKIIESTYRLSKYVLSYQIDRGILLFNVLTGELIALEEKEIDISNIKENNKSLYFYLINRWFLFPDCYNEVILSEQVKETMRLVMKSLPKKAITDFTVFPTTDCNARCFYCFEKNRQPITMSEKTANDVADYIIKVSKSNKIKINWFGGEPVYNYKVIDTICHKLKNYNIDYSSMMVSNGYLFNEELVLKAKDLWNLNYIQITIDGTEKIYNNIKAYIDKTFENPFSHVLDNIELLLKNQIYVRIRMNMDKYNRNDLYDLVNILITRFGCYDNFGVYSHLLFEDTTKEMKQRDDKTRHKLIDDYLALEDYIIKKNISLPYSIDGRLRYRQCMADNDSATTILPDGHLGKCEHYTDKCFWGSIYEDQIDYTMIEKFIKLKNKGEQCKNCSLYPACMELESCPSALTRCDEFDKKLRFYNVERCVRGSYENFVKNKEN